MIGDGLGIIAVNTATTADKKDGHDPVNGSFFILYSIMIFTNSIDAMPAVLMKRQGKNGLYLYIFSSLILVSTLVLIMEKYFHPLHISGYGVSCLVMVILYVSCFDITIKAE